MKRWIGTIAFAICAAFLATAVARAADSANGANADAVAGIWVLQQVNGMSGLDAEKERIHQALEFPGVVGFSLRVPWIAIDENFELLEAGKALADAHNLAFSLRFMAGRHTPERVYEAGSPYYTLQDGREKTPTPFTADGEPNMVFEGIYDEFVGKLAVWCRANGVRLLHLPWYGQDWAELNHGVQVREAEGYAYDAWHNAHIRLIDIGLKYSGPDLAVEFPFSGHGPTGDTVSQFADYVWDKIGPANDIFFFQANGWSPNGEWGSPSEEMEALKDRAFERPVCRGLQMIQPQNYDWAPVFQRLYDTKATYGEIYTPSFSLANAEQLRAEIVKFSAHVAQVEKGPRPDGGKEKPDSLTMVPATSNAEAISGTWALQQVQSIEELQRILPTVLEPALSAPNIRGFSLRVPWNAIDGSFALLDEGRKIARDHNLEFSVRFMAGRHTPARVFDNGSPYYLRGEEKVPAPFHPDGSPNTAFEKEYDYLTSHLAAWCRANGVRLLHLAWYGQDWAELNHGREVRALEGYSYENWLNAHLRQIDIGLRAAGESLAVEFPFSGYGPLTDAAQDFADHVIERIGPNRPIFFCQANGWGPNGEWGAPSPETEAAFDRVWEKSILRGLQSIQPRDYNWTGVFQRLYDVNATYCEVYTPSFGDDMEHKPQLLEAIAAFDDHARKIAAPAPEN